MRSVFKAKDVLKICLFERCVVIAWIGSLVPVCTALRHSRLPSRRRSDRPSPEKGDFAIVPL